ncbi:MAG TPA: DUF971 domain-containing protein [Burkholderiaceae bacterium]|nr:DUF971 domain-containing protein [Burkholderiaceae bacterium]
MAGIDKDTPTPTRIVVHQKSRILELGFEDGRSLRLPFELMRVYSPSAEVRGHGPGQEVLQVGKRDVEILAIEPVGHYAIQPSFSDGHATGIFSWDYLYWLGENQDELWREYLGRLEQAGASRDPGPGTGAAPAVPAGPTTLAATALSRPRS